MPGLLAAQAPGEQITRLFTKAREQLHQSEYRKAILSLDSCIRLDSTRALLYNWRACATQYQGPVNEKKNCLEAIRFYTKAIALDSLQFGYYANRAFAWQNLDKGKQALADYRKALSLDTSNVQLYGHVLRSLWIQRRNKEALAYASLVFLKFPEHGYAYYVWGQLKRDYLHQYADGNQDIKRSELLGWEHGIPVYY